MNKKVKEILQIILVFFLVICLMHGCSKYFKYAEVKQTEKINFVGYSTINEMQHRVYWIKIKNTDTLFQYVRVSDGKTTLYSTVNFTD